MFSQGVSWIEQIQAFNHYLRKTADISNSDNVDGEIPEKVDDLRSFGSEGVEENERGHNGWDQLVQKVGRRVREELTQFGHDLKNILQYSMMLEF